jgi:methionine synthase II (cobalamin-independent)
LRRSCSISSPSTRSSSNTSPIAPAPFEPLRFVPPGKTVVLGLIRSKVPELESTDALRRRIDEASRYVPLERLALSPQCGFASAKEGNLLTEDEQRHKLQLVVETARLVWQ